MELDLIVWYTAKNSTVYAILLGWPEKNLLQLMGPKTSVSTRVTLMDYPSKPLIWAPVSKTGGLLIILPLKPVSPANAWCLKLEKVS